MFKSSLLVDESSRLATIVNYAGDFRAIIAAAEKDAHNPNTLY